MGLDNGMMISIKMRKLLAPSMQSGLIQVFRDRVEIPFRIARYSSGSFPDVDQHQRQMAVNQDKQLRQDKDGNQREELRDHLRQQEQHQPVLPPFKAEAGEGVSGKLTLIGSTPWSEADFIEFSTGEE